MQKFQQFSDVALIFGRRGCVFKQRFAILPPGVICVRNLRNVIIIEDAIDAGFQLSKLASINEKRLAATVAPADSFVFGEKPEARSRTLIDPARIKQTICGVSKTLVLDIKNGRLQSSPKGAAMDQDLMSLRKRMIGTSIKFIQAQRALLNAAAANARRSETELKEAVEEYLKAAEPYGAALQELYEYLLAAEPSEAIDVELGHTERLIDALDKEKRVGSKLITHYLQVRSRLGRNR